MPSIVRRYWMLRTVLTHRFQRCEPSVHPGLRLDARTGWKKNEVRTRTYLKVWRTFHISVETHLFPQIVLEICSITTCTQPTFSIVRHVSFSPAWKVQFRTRGGGEHSASGFSRASACKYFPGNNPIQRVQREGVSRGVSSSSRLHGSAHTTIRIHFCVVNALWAPRASTCQESTLHPLVGRDACELEQQLGSRKRVVCSAQRIGNIHTFRLLCSASIAASETTTIVMNVLGNEAYECVRLNAEFRFLLHYAWISTVNWMIGMEVFVNCHKKCQMMSAFCLTISALHSLVESNFTRN